jgi:hypothetical protein
MTRLLPRVPVEGETVNALAMARDAILRTLGFAALAGAAACSTLAAGPGNAPPNEPAALDLKVQQCHDACDEMKLFSCNTALDHATCYADCQQATPDQLDEFNGCVHASGANCDPGCSTQIQPKPSPSGGAANGTAGGSSAGDANPSGGSGGPPANPANSVDPAAPCKEECQQLSFFQCISAAEQATCEGLCDAPSGSARDAFVSCATAKGSASCDGLDCYQTFNPNAPKGATPKEVSDCTSACDDAVFFTCIDATDQAHCRAQCTSEPRSAVQTYAACERSAGGNCASQGDCLGLL